jgi:hypothetical protein
MAGLAILVLISLPRALATINSTSAAIATPGATTSENKRNRR